MGRVKGNVNIADALSKHVKGEHTECTSTTQYDNMIGYAQTFFTHKLTLTVRGGVFGSPPLLAKLTIALNSVNRTSLKTATSKNKQQKNRKR